MGKVLAAKFTENTFDETIGENILIGNINIVGREWE